MCGIAACFGRGELNEAVLLEALHHRGPDARGAWRTALSGGTRLQLLHTRLKVLDLTEAAAQPMMLRRAAAKNQDLVVVFNGEIYNYRELRAELKNCGHEFRSTGDTEVLLHAYAEWGEGAFARFDGMFALALYDGPRRRLVLARDHAGIKPLYHARTKEGGLLFASEVRAIVRSGQWLGGVDREGVADLLQFGSLQEPRTVWEGIRAFPPGHWGYVRLDEGAPAALQVQPYWLPEAIDLASGSSGADWVEEHDAILRATVAEQLVSDVPLGVYLSGGIDSTLLTELAADAGGRGRISAFTLAGAATENDEAELAASAAKRAGVAHQVVHLTPGNLAVWVRDGLAAMDQPSADGINTYLVSRASRQAGLVVALGGTGADELHGAYGHARTLARLQAALRTAGPLRGAGTRAAAGALRWRRGTVAGERLALLCAAAPISWRMAYERRRYFTPRERAVVWPGGLGVDPRWSPPFTTEPVFFSRGLREQVRLAEVRGYLLNTLLRDADWATMANQQELRVPFLGRRYVECVLRAPEAATAQKGAVKKPRLTALLSAESRRVAELPKRGFVLNYVDLLLGPQREEFAAAAARLNRDLGFAIEVESALGRLTRERSGNYSRRLWSLLALGGYLERFAA